MCQEVFEIVKTMDLSNIEVRLALQCAPVITGIKLSNLLSISKEKEALVEEILAGTRIDFFCLSRQENRSVYLLFRSQELKMYLKQIRIRQILSQCGYTELSIAGILERFRERYTWYLINGGDFPHEMGLLLGYPIEDVEGFIKNKGENYLYTGYWKVYKDVEDKKLLFEAYENAKEGLLLLVGHGYDIRKIMEYFENRKG